MNTFFNEHHRRLQQQFDSEALADRVAMITLHDEINEQDRDFISSRDMFFLATVDAEGQPSCSYKGGAVGFVRVLDGKTLAFPSYDGNGMFLSLGNIDATAKVGLLFIDLEKPNRLRVQGTAVLSGDDPLLAEYPGADLIVRVTVSAVFVNCPRYIHQYQKLATSQYVPQAGQATPFAQWKRIDALQDALPLRDQGQAAAAGGCISPEAYSAKVMAGEG